MKKDKPKVKPTSKSKVIDIKSDLKDTDEITYLVQQQSSASLEWVNIFWFQYNKLLTPFLKDGVKNSLVEFKSKEPAVAASKLIKETYPQENLRVIKRHTVIKEILLKE